MLLESMIDDGEDDRTDSHSSRKNLNRLPQPHSSQADLNEKLLLLNANEQLTVSPTCGANPLQLVSPFGR